MNNELNFSLLLYKHRRVIWATFILISYFLKLDKVITMNWHCTEISTLKNLPSLFNRKTFSNSASIAKSHLVAVCSHEC